MRSTFRLCVAAVFVGAPAVFASCGAYVTEPGDPDHGDYGGSAGSVGQSGASGATQSGGSAGSVGAGNGGASGASEGSGNRGVSGSSGVSGNGGDPGSGGGSGDGGVSGNGGASISGGAAGNGGAAGSGGVSGSGGSAGSAGAGGNGGAQATFAAVQAIIASSCASCHRTRAPILSTTGATLYSTLTTRTSSRCGGDRLVAPNDPDNSALVGITVGSCSPRMPRYCPTSRPCLSESEIQTFRSWIAAGAPGP